MLKVGKVVIVLYAVAMLGGGIAGYATKGSLPSLLSGIGSAVLLAIAFAMLSSKPKTGFGISLGVAVVLVGVFILRAVQTQAEPESFKRNISLAVFSAVVAAIFGKCLSETL